VASGVTAVYIWFPLEIFLICRVGTCDGWHRLVVQGSKSTRSSPPSTVAYSPSGPSAGAIVTFPSMSSSLPWAIATVGTSKIGATTTAAARAPVRVYYDKKRILRGRFTSVEGYSRGNTTRVVIACQVDFDINLRRST